MNLSWFAVVFRALRHRNYRLFVTGQILSLTGTWMQQMALSWLVYRMSGSVVLLGVVGFAQQVPTFLLAPIAGVIADRQNRQHLLILTQGLAMLQAVVLAGLVLSGTVKIWEIITLSLFLGGINAFDIPVRQSFVIEMIEDKEDLSNAIALNSSMVNLARLIGPSLAGFLIALAGEGMCFLLNALSYLAVILSLIIMRVPQHKIPGKGTNAFSQLKEGFSYAFQSSPIRILLVLLGIVSMVAGGLAAMMPVFAKDIFHGGPQTLGFLMGASGMGALTGAIYLAGRRTVLGLGRVIGRVSALFAVGVMAFSISRIYWLSMTLIFISAFGMMVEMAASNTVIQVIVDDDKRGRVMSLYAMAFMGMAPVGSLIAGGLAHRFGVGAVLFAGGLLCLISASVYWTKLKILREKIRPIYAEKGIIPQVADGLRSATLGDPQR